MTKLEKLVSDAITLDQQIVEMEAKAKLLRDQLVAHAKLDKDNHTKTDGGGWSWVANDEDGNIARVTVAGRSIKEGIDLEGELTDKVREIVPKGVFSDLFLNATYYKLVDKFRERAVQLLGTDAAKVIKLVTSSGKTSLSFETKKAEVA